MKTGNYTQVWKNNMEIVGDPVIKGKGISGVEIQFEPDLSRFNTTLEEYKDVVVRLFEARVYDAVICSPDRIKISLQGKQLKTKTLPQYVSLFTDSKPLIDVESQFWKVAIVPADKFSAIGFVNGCCCNDGTHITHVLNQIIEAVSQHKKLKDKDVKNLVKKPTDSPCREEGWPCNHDPWLRRRTGLRT